MTDTLCETDMAFKPSTTTYQIRRTTLWIFSATTGLLGRTALWISPAKSAELGPSMKPQGQHSWSLYRKSNPRPPGSAETSKRWFKNSRWPPSYISIYSYQSSMQGLKIDSPESNSAEHQTQSSPKCIDMVEFYSTWLNQIWLSSDQVDNEYQTLKLCVIYIN